MEDGMKKMAYIFTLVFILFMSCKHEYGIITNVSDYIVSGETTSGREFTLNPRQSIDIVDYYERIKSFSATPPRVLLKKDGDNLVFYNTPAISLYVYNATNVSAELYAQNCIGDGSEPVTIAANFSGDTHLGIYNSKPDLTAFLNVSGAKYPGIVTYTYDLITNRITATIR
jgi:hypothetical protein